MQRAGAGGGRHAGDTLISQTCDRSTYMCRTPRHAVTRRDTLLKNPSQPQTCPPNLKFAALPFPLQPHSKGPWKVTCIIVQIALSTNESLLQSRRHKVTSFCPKSMCRQLASHWRVLDYFGNSALAPPERNCRSRPPLLLKHTATPFEVAMHPRP